MRLHRVACLLGFALACQEEVMPSASPDASDAARPADAAPPADGAPHEDAGPPPLPGWDLIWSDEFDGSGNPDPTKWGYEVGYLRNSELQYYTSGRLENARVENGHLVIEARRDFWQGHEITSASLTTQGKAAFRYGRIEVRAQIPTGNGTWPAVWTLGTNIDAVGWPTCGEIDIMENVGFMPTTIYGTVHRAAQNGSGRGGSVDVTAPFRDYHRYAIEWFPDRIDFFVDDQKYFTYANDGGGVATWPFDADQYLLLNLAIGGSWGGQQGVDLSLFPHSYLIDYVRVYRHQ
ncbi:MAG TPA: glycoside hydrolase family 16 protein [Polyangia bacterium]|nr:glycoside hydrolase family 16 protein [Polyangia bacterium]